MTLTPFHIAVQVRDIDEARRFYKDVLSSKPDAQSSGAKVGAPSSL